MGDPLMERGPHPGSRTTTASDQQTSHLPANTAVAVPLIDLVTVAAAVPSQTLALTSDAAEGQRQRRPKHPASTATVANTPQQTRETAAVGAAVLPAGLPGATWPGGCSGEH